MFQAEFENISIDFFYVFFIVSRSFGEIKIRCCQIFLLHEELALWSRWTRKNQYYFRF